MVKTIKEIIGCTVTLVLIIAIIHKLGILVRPAYSGIVFNSVEVFHNLPEDSVEVICYGSSHMWTGIDSMRMYEQYGVGIYNYGGNWQHINTTELFFKDSLLTQSPKVILIDTYLVNELIQDVDLNGEIYSVRKITESVAKQQYLRQCLGGDKERYLSYYVPLCAFHDNWINFGQDFYLESVYDPGFASTMGYYRLNNRVEPITIPDVSTFEQEALSEEAIRILDEIVSICKEEDIDIIFLTIPWGENFKYGDAMKEFAAQNDCVYFNLFEYIEELGIDEDTDFKDIGHLNPEGAVKVTDFLGEYIINNYDVTDMRTIEGNIWEQNLQ